MTFYKEGTLALRCSGRKAGDKGKPAENIQLAAPGAALPSLAYLAVS
jgi:hypothetical protein